MQIEKSKTSCYEVEYIVDMYNSRLKIEDYRGNIRLIVKDVLKEAEKNKVEKMIIKSRREHLFELLGIGFMLEAVIKGYFLGSDAFLVTKYFSNIRRNSEYWEKEDTILHSILEQPSDPSIPTLEPHFQLRKATSADAENLASFYSQIFQVYPTPLNDSEYVKKVIEETTCFYLITDQDVIVSAASAEMNLEYKNAELTDCATLPSHRKHGLMKILLVQLEKELIQSGIFCSYSIARSLSYGMNACFYQLGYSYTGRLTNNCNIYDKMEDMNVWVKNLSLNSAE